MNERLRALTDWVLLAGFCAFLFFYGLGSFGLIGADEPRYAQVAREMLARHDWITPTLGGVAWLEKPALYYWEAILSYRLFGVSDWACAYPFRNRRHADGVCRLLVSSPVSARIAFGRGIDYRLSGRDYWILAGGVDGYAPRRDTHHRAARMVCLA